MKQRMNAVNIANLINAIMVKDGGIQSAPKLLTVFYGTAPTRTINAIFIHSLDAVRVLTGIRTYAPITTATLNFFHLLL